MSAEQVIMTALHCSEAECLRAGEVPGYSLWAHDVLAALRAAGFAVVAVPTGDELAAEQRRYSLSVEPSTLGLPPIREDGAGWLVRRFVQSEARRQAAVLLATADQVDANANAAEAIS